jgi:hypothetical protein
MSTSAHTHRGHASNRRVTRNEIECVSLSVLSHVFKLGLVLDGLTASRRSCHDLRARRRKVLLCDLNRGPDS